MDDTFVFSGFDVVVDSRESAPYRFENLPNEGRKLVVRSVTRGLKTGDYSIAGFEHRVAVERKSLPDLFNCLGGDRARFVNQLTRLNNMECAMLIVESSWEDAMNEPPSRSRLSPRSVNRSYLAFTQRFANVQWFWSPDRRSAEIQTYRYLDRWHTDHEKDLTASYSRRHMFRLFEQEVTAREQINALADRHMDDFDSDEHRVVANKRCKSSPVGVCIRDETHCLFCHGGEVVLDAES